MCNLNLILKFLRQLTFDKYELSDFLIHLLTYLQDLLWKLFAIMLDIWRWNVQVYDESSTIVGNFSSFLNVQNTYSVFGFSTNPLELRHGPFGGFKTTPRTPTPPVLKNLNPLLFSGIVQIILVYTKNADNFRTS